MAGLAALAAAWAPQIFNDGDTFMHVAAGERMLAARAVLTTDPFSFTFGGRPWQTHEWLSEVLMALAFRLGGWSAVALLTATAFGATAGLLIRHAGRWLAGPPLAATVVVGLASLAPSLLARPHMLALPLLEMWCAELVVARVEGRMPDVRRLALLMLLWANVHASFLFGLALLGACGFDAVIRERGDARTLLRWTGLAGVSALAACLGPHGLDTLLFPLRIMSLAALPHIDEWRAMTPAAQPAFEAALLAGAFVLIRVRARFTLLSLGLLLLLVWMALGQARHVLLFGVVAPLLIAQPLGEALARPAVAPPRRRPLWARGLGAGALAIIVAAPRLAVPVRIAESPTAPFAALRHVPPALRRQPVLNDYAFGGYLILAGGAPYVDSRAEVYGGDFLQAYGRLAAGDPTQLAAALADRRIRWSLLQPGTPLAAEMDRAPGWRRLYADRFAVVHVREG
ncbi:hypothetical protein ACO2Q3_22325 [Caulobacter sp. KR2-114]|uniref:hypothetical protein n=1 Tax=Caulobacter sp. KR2-114 TaxID=3400912 RepID=UPI003C111CB1